MISSKFMHASQRAFGFMYFLNINILAAYNKGNDCATIRVDIFMFNNYFFPYF